MEHKVQIAVDCGGRERKKGIQLRNWKGNYVSETTVTIEPMLLDDTNAGELVYFTFFLAIRALFQKFGVTQHTYSIGSTHTTLLSFRRNALKARNTAILLQINYSIYLHLI